MPSVSVAPPSPERSLARWTTLGVGGPARWFAEARHVDEVAAYAEWSATRGFEMLVLGGGSNLVVADEGFDGLVLHVGVRGVTSVTTADACEIVAGAGEPWDAVVASVVDRGLAGLECLSGIPGSVGGTPIQNVGAYGQEVSDAIEAVTVFDRRTGAAVSLSAAECGFSYRASRFKGVDAGRFIVCDVRFRVRRGVPTASYPDVRAHLDSAGLRSPTVADVRQAVLTIRRRKGMVLDESDPDTRSVGSFFVNPVVSALERARLASVVGGPVPGFDLPDGRVKVPAAWLIERAGFRKGDRDGAAAISTKHTLALVNAGGATARDVLRLASRISREVSHRFGVKLRPEPVCVGFTNDPDVDYLQKADD